MGATRWPIVPGHPLRFCVGLLGSASPSLCEGEGDHKGSPLRFVVPDLVGEGEGLRLAAGVDEDDWCVRVHVAELDFGD